MSKKYLKGFNNLGAIPVEENAPAAYKATGEMVKLPGARSCAVTDNKTDYSIPGDDAIYDSGADWKDTTLVITVNEMELEALGKFTGAVVSKDAVDELEEGVYDTAPEYALTFSALRGDGGYRLYRYYAAKLTNYKITHNTKGDTNEAQTYELTFSCRSREIDGKVRGTKDIDAGAALTWLETIPELPETTPAA